MGFISPQPHLVQNYCFPKRFISNWCEVVYRVLYNDVIISAMASQITSLTIVNSTVYSRRRSKETSKLRVTGLCEGNSPVTGEFPIQRTSNAENIFDDVIMSTNSQRYRCVQSAKAFGLQEFWLNRLWQFISFLIELEICFVILIECPYRTNLLVLPRFTSDTSFIIASASHNIQKSVSNM